VILSRKGAKSPTWLRSAVVDEHHDGVRADGELAKSLTLRGYINYEFAADHYPAFLRTVGAAVADGRIRYREDITDGLENAPAAFIGMLQGSNFGKALVRIAPSA
jgi:NADPH-dependent curcumin reductase CurA